MEEDGQCPFCMTEVKAGASVCPSCNAQYGVKYDKYGTIVDLKEYESRKKFARKGFRGSLALFAGSLLLRVVTGVEAFNVGIYIGGFVLFFMFKGILETLGKPTPAWFR